MGRVPIRWCGGLLVALLCVVAVGNAQEAARPAPRMAVFSPDGKRLAVVTGELEEKGAVTVWDVATLRLLWAHGEPRRPPPSLSRPTARHS